jgi:AcrR family transcriptional regulator
VKAGAYRAQIPAARYRFPASPNDNWRDNNLTTSSTNQAVNHLVETWGRLSHIDARKATTHAKPKRTGTLDKFLRNNRSTNGAERRRAIVRAAYQTLAEKGFEGLRMREIAKRAGIDHSTLHYYFAGKEALIDGIVDHIVQDLSIGRTPAIESGEIGPRQRLIAHFDALIQQMRERPEMFVVLAEIHARSMRDPAVRSIVARNDRGWKRFLIEILQAGIQEKEFHTELVPEVAAETIISFVRGLTVTCASQAGLMKRPLQQLLRWLEGDR